MPVVCVTSSETVTGLLQVEFELLFNTRMLRIFPKHRIRVRAILAARLCHSEAARSESTIRPYDDIPGPRGLPVVGSAHRYIRNGGFSKFYKTNMKFFDQYGPIFKETFAGSEVVWIADPKEIEKVFRVEGKYPNRFFPPDNALARYRTERGQHSPMLLLNGEEWYRQRKAVAQKLMRPKELHDNLDNFNAVATDAITSLILKRGQGKTEGIIEDLEHELTIYTTEAIGTFVFDARFGGYEQPLRPDAVAFVENAKILNKTFMELTIGFEAMLYHYFDTPTWKVFCKAHDVLHEIGEKFVKYKMNEIEKIGEDLETILQDDTRVVPLLIYLLVKSDLTPDEIVTHSLDMFGAGVDTTAVTLMWLLGNIARRPDIQEKLHEEITGLVGEDGDLTAQDLKHIPYLRACLKESIRMVPPFTANARVVEQDIELNGYHVPAKTPVMMSAYHVAHSSDYYKDPADFRPERWLRDEGDIINPFANIPFGFGTRMCVGKRAAEMEIFVFMTKLIQRFRLECKDDPPEPVMRLILSPEKPISINLIDRDT